MSIVYLYLIIPYYKYFFIVKQFSFAIGLNELFLLPLMCSGGASRQKVGGPMAAPAAQKWGDWREWGSGKMLGPRPFLLGNALFLLGNAPFSSI